VTEILEVSCTKEILTVLKMSSLEIIKYMQSRHPEVLDKIEILAHQYKMVPAEPCVV